MNNVLRISPSKLEQFRKCVDQVWNGYITQEKFFEYLRGETKFSDKVSIGTAYHEILEHGSKKFWDSATSTCIVPESWNLSEPVSFNEEEVRAAEHFRKLYPHMIYEIPYEMILYVDGYKVIVPMRIDGMNGIEVHEQKTLNKADAYDEDQYFESYQWRVYLMAVQAKIVQYNIFAIHTLKESRTIKYGYFRFYRYDRMEDDVRALISHMISFLKSHNELGLIKQYK